MVFRAVERAWVGLAILSVAACARRPPEAGPQATSVHVPPPAASSAGPAETRGPTDSQPRSISDADPLLPGLVRFEGMAAPTKGGIDVRGVTFSVEALSDALATTGAGRVQESDLLGAKLAVVAELARESAEEPSDGGEVVQSRAGTWLLAKRLLSARIAAPPRAVTGEVTRSKGYYAVGSYLISRRDLAWSLPGQDPVGKRVRLWGQPRTVVCDPNAQCLIGGSLPLFDVGRAELVR